MTRTASRALLGAAAIASALAAAAFADLSPDQVIAREIGTARAAPLAPPPPDADQDRLARIGAVILLGLEWSLR